MDKSNEICGVSLSGFGTTLKIWNNFQAIWTHQGPRPKSWGKSFNFNPIIGYDTMDPTLHQNPHWASRWLFRADDHGYQNSNAQFWYLTEIIKL
jgi:hypothetical protein